MSEPNQPPGEWSPEGVSQPPRPRLAPDDVPRVPKELRDEEALSQDDEESPGYLDEEEQEPHREVAETVGTTELPCGIGETEFPCGVVDGEDPDSSGGASDIDQGY